jgi:hypothetical protein
MQSKREATHRNHPHTFGVTQEVKDLVDRKMYLQAQYGSDSEYKTGYNLSSTSPQKDSRAREREVSVL